MRPMGIAVAPAAPTIVSALNTPTPVTVTWTDNSKNETNWTIQRMDAGTGWTTVGTKTTSDEVGTGGTETYNDTTFLPSTEYTYRVLASNVIGYTKTYTLPVIGYPHPSTDSPPSGTASVTTGP